MPMITVPPLTTMDPETIAMINADPKRYQWQPFESESGYYYVLCDMNKDHNGNLILEKKEEEKKDQPFVKAQDPHSAALQPMYKNGKRVVAVEK